MSIVTGQINLLPTNSYVDHPVRFTGGYAYELTLNSSWAFRLKFELWDLNGAVKYGAINYVEGSGFDFGAFEVETSGTYLLRVVTPGGLSQIATYSLNLTNSYPIAATTDHEPDWLNASLLGDHEVGSTLTAGLDYTDTNGTSGSVPQYIWYRYEPNANTYTEIQRSTSQQYTIQSADIDHTIAFQVQFTDDDGFVETSSLYSISGKIIALSDHEPDWLNASLLGDHEVGSTLTAGLDYTDTNGTSGSVPQYIWYRYEPNANTYTEIQRSTSQQYTIQSADIDHTIAFQVQFTDDDGFVETSSLYAISGNLVKTGNSLPLAQNTTLSATEGLSSTIDVSGLISDPDNDALTVSLIGSPTSGTATLTGTTITYAPEGDNPPASDSIVYQVDDGNGGVSTGTIDVSIAGVNDAPLAQDSTLSATEGQSSTIDVSGLISDPDNDALTVSLVGSPTSGTATLSGTTITYTPEGDAPPASDSIVYQVEDGNEGISTGTIDVSIAGVNDAPMIISPSVSSSGNDPWDPYTSFVSADGSLIEIMGTEWGRLGVLIGEDYTDRSGGGTVGWLDVSDVDSDQFVISLSGPDAAFFVAEDGQLYGSSNPSIHFGDFSDYSHQTEGAFDYENPLDANRDNIYEFTITVSDGELSDSVDIRLNVRDFDEVPVLERPISEFVFSPNTDISISSSDFDDYFSDSDWVGTGSPPLDFSFNGFPDFLDAGLGSEVAVGRASISDIGTHTATLTATDSTGLSAETVVTISIVGNEIENVISDYIYIDEDTVYNNGFTDLDLIIDANGLIATFGGSDLYLNLDRESYIFPDGTTLESGAGMLIRDEQSISFALPDDIYVANDQKFYGSDANEYVNFWSELPDETRVHWSGGYDFFNAPLVTNDRDGQIQPSDYFWENYFATGSSSGVTINGSTADSVTLTTEHGVITGLNFEEFWDSPGDDTIIGSSMDNHIRIYEGGADVVTTGDGEDRIVIFYEEKVSYEPEVFRDLEVTVTDLSRYDQITFQEMNFDPVNYRDQLTVAYDDFNGVTTVSVDTNSYTNSQLITLEGQYVVASSNVWNGDLELQFFEGDRIPIDASAGGEVIGGSTPDRIEGDQNAMIALAGDGDDLILDSSIEDYLAGEAGNDEIESDGGADWILGGDGDDQITLTADSYWGSDAVAMNTTLMDLSTGAWRTAAFDVEGLGKYQKVLDGGADSDTIIMGDEGEALFLHDALSDFYPDDGLNLQTDISGRDSTARVLGIETIYAGGGDDLLDMTSFDYASDTGLTAYGEDGNDTLWATELNDTLYGGMGDDTLFGDAGNDIFYGGEGFDRFEFSVGAGFDQIMDFNIDEDILAFYARKSLFGSEADDTDISLTNGVVSWEDVSIDLMDDTLNNLDDLNVEFTVV